MIGKLCIGEYLGSRARRGKGGIEERRVCRGNMHHSQRGGTDKKKYYYSRPFLFFVYRELSLRKGPDWLDCVGAHVFLGKIDKRGGGNGVLGRCHLLDGDQLDISHGRNCAERVQVEEVYRLFLDFFLIWAWADKACLNPMRQRGRR